MSELRERYESARRKFESLAVEIAAKVRTAAGTENVVVHSYVRGSQPGDVFHFELVANAVAPGGHCREFSISRCVSLHVGYSEPLISFEVGRAAEELGESICGVFSVSEAARIAESMHMELWDLAVRRAGIPLPHGRWKTGLWENLTRNGFVCQVRAAIELFDRRHCVERWFYIAGSEFSKKKYRELATKAATEVGEQIARMQPAAMAESLELVAEWMGNEGPLEMAGFPERLQEIAGLLRGAVERVDFTNFTPGRGPAAPREGIPFFITTVQAAEYEGRQFMAARREAIEHMEFRPPLPSPEETP